MKILMTTDTVGGVWDYSCTLARSFRDKGHEVRLAILGDLHTIHESSVPKGVEIDTLSCRLEWMSDSSADVNRANDWIAGLASLWGADVVHLHQYACALADFAAPTVLVAHSDVLSWFSETSGKRAPEEWAEYTARVHAGLRRASAVVAPTAYQSRLLARHYGRAADRVIHNGAVPPEAQGESADFPLIVCVARAWDTAKGIQVLDQAVGRLGSAAPSVHLIGSVQSPDGQRATVHNLMVHGVLDRPKVNRWLERSKIYVSPSLYEPFGLAPLEAALHGCALVLSDIGSFRELWDGCAEFFPPGDSEALAEILDHFPQDTEHISRLAEAARQRAHDRYTAGRMADEYLALYSECAPLYGRMVHNHATQPA